MRFKSAKQVEIECWLMAAAMLVWVVPASMLIRAAMFGWGAILK